MRRPLLLLLLAAAITAFPVSANHRGNDRWDAKRVTVYDYTQPVLDGYIQTVVRNWNLALGGGLRLVYQREDATNCPSVDPIKGAMVVCSRAEWDAYPAGITYLWVNTDKHTIIKTKTILVATGTHGSGTSYWSHPLGCHELGHALGLNHWYTETDSCLGTQMQTPGSHDAEALQRMYGGDGGYVADPPQMCCEELEIVQ